MWYTTEDLKGIFNEEYSPLFEKRFHQCTAIICYNDQVAVKALELLNREGCRVPDDISLISFDDSELCEISRVKLTSVSHAREGMGREAARTLLKVIDGKPRVNVVLPSKLVIRNSVASRNSISESNTK